jgi:hypothetical protein
MNSPDRCTVNLKLMMTMEEASNLAHAINRIEPIERPLLSPHSDVCQCDECTMELDDGDL